MFKKAKMEKTCLLPQYQELMSQMEDIIEHVLERLPMKTLHSCSLVCRKWNSAVKRIKRSRRQIGWLLYDEEGPPVEDQIDPCLQSLSSQPEAAVIFCSSELFDEQKISVLNQPRQSRNMLNIAKRHKMEVGSYMQTKLPPKCALYGVIADGIIGTNADISSIVELESSSALSCLLLPALSSLKLYSFHSERDLEERLGSVVVSTNTRCPDPERLAAITGIPSDQQPKLVLLFYTEQFAYIETDIGAALIKHYKNLVVAGACVDELMQEEDRSGEAILHGLAFCGSDLQVASVILKSHIRTPQQAEECIAKLKTAHIPEQNTVGLMFACIARGRAHYDKDNVEADAFHKVFPRTPLFGLFGNGEVGYEYLPDYSTAEGDSSINLIGQYTHNEDDEDQPDIPADLPDMYHSYCTVFVLLSVPPK